MNAEEITQKLKACCSGNNEAMNELLPVVYDELHRLAHRYFKKERENHVLQTTALVHEAYLKLIDQRSVNWQNRAHFFGIAANMMRRILVDYAKSRDSKKRGGNYEDVSLEEACFLAVQERNLDIIDLDHALTLLEELDERQSKIVELRFFSGLDVEETAETLGISPATVKRDWKTAKTWLKLELEGKNKI